MKKTAAVILGVLVGPILFVKFCTWWFKFQLMVAKTMFNVDSWESDEKMAYAFITAVVALLIFCSIMAFFEEPKKEEEN